MIGRVDMRRVIVSEFLSLDGVMKAPHEWHFPFWHDDMGKYKYDELFASDALLLGRVTYAGFAAAWPERSEVDHQADIPLDDERLCRPHEHDAQIRRVLLAQDGRLAKLDHHQ